jgi:hypothetical protein
MLGACAQIVGIEDPKPVEDRPPIDSSSSGSSGSSGTGGTSGSSSSGSSSSNSGGPVGPWVGWRMPNPASAGLPNPSNYTIDSTNDTVLDNVTGLMWQRTVDGGYYAWAAAGTYCQNLVHAGHDDWRLPWRIELVSLIDYTTAHPAIDAAFPNTPSENFWANSKEAFINGSAWYVFFDMGDINVDTVDKSYRVRCVR